LRADHSVRTSRRTMLSVRSMMKGASSMDKTIAASTGCNTSAESTPAAFAW
jgi:hypothetical protein